MTGAMLCFVVRLQFRLQTRRRLMSGFSAKPDQVKGACCVCFDPNRTLSAWLSMF
jgi:hypothetical protein